MQNLALSALAGNYFGGDFMYLLGRSHKLNGLSKCGMFNLVAVKGRS